MTPEKKIDLENAIMALAQKQKDIENAMKMLPEQPSKSLLEKLDERIAERDEQLSKVLNAIDNELKQAFGQGLLAAWMAMCKAMIAAGEEGHKGIIENLLNIPLLLSNPKEYLLATVDPLNRLPKTLRDGVDTWNAVKDFQNAAGAAIGMWDKQEKIDPRIKKTREDSAKYPLQSTKSALDAVKNETNSEPSNVHRI